MVQDAVDNEAIIATVMDYFEGWFDGNPERMERALHPNLDKRGVRVDTVQREWCSWTRGPPRR